MAISWRAEGRGGVHQESSVHSGRMLQGTASPRPRNASHPTPPPGRLLPHRHSPSLRLFRGMVLWPMKSFLEEAS